jgi:hypothetical protein
MYLSAILGIALYRKFWYKSLHTINFDNPVYRKTTEENVNLERDPSSVSMTSSVTMSTSVSANGAKRSYTSNTLATDVSEVSMAYKHFVTYYFGNFCTSLHVSMQNGILSLNPSSNKQTIYTFFLKKGQKNHLIKQHNV